jgi:hypothetical protein
MISKITGGPTRLLFTEKVLNSHEVKYYECVETGFIQTEDPYWLQEAYSSAITKLDTGLIFRNELLRDKLVKIIPDFFNADRHFLDYAGGYGMFTRMMRDKGFDFYHHDIYCENLFAEYFSLADAPEKLNFELVTAFEVFEHLVDPMEEIKRILEFGDNLIFTTELVPGEIAKASDWWYFTPETGQHIAFYTRKSLDYIADKLGCYYRTDGIQTHIFTRDKKLTEVFEGKQEPYLIRTMRRKLARFERGMYPERKSLLHQDWQTIKNRLK